MVGNSLEGGQGCWVATRSKYREMAQVAKALKVYRLSLTFTHLYSNNKAELGYHNIYSRAITPAMLLSHPRMQPKP